jgi:hypothetical protein
MWKEYRDNILKCKMRESITKASVSGQKTTSQTKRPRGGVAE